MRGAAILLLSSTAYSYIPNDFASSGETCASSWPPRTLKCPTFCVKVEGTRDETLLKQRCGSKACEGADQVLFYTGECTSRTNSPLCADAATLKLHEDLQLYVCDNAEDLAATANPCGCVSGAADTSGNGSVYQACPAQQVDHEHYSPGLDYHPPLLETMQVCAGDLFPENTPTNTDAFVLSGASKDQQSGFLQCPLELDTVPAYSEGGWLTLAIIYLLCLLIILTWAIYKFFKERPLLKADRTPVLRTDANADEAAAPVLIGKKDLPIDRQETGLSLAAEGRTSEPASSTVKAGCLSNSGLTAQIGYCQPCLGRLGLIAFITVVAVKPIALLIYILDGYGFFGTTFCADATAKCLQDQGLSEWSFRLGWQCGAHCLVSDAWSTGLNRFWPYNKGAFGGKMYLVVFLHTWLMGVVIFLAALAARMAIRASFRLLAPIGEASLVEVQVPARDRLRVERVKRDTLDRYMEWENSVVRRWFGTNMDRKVCKVQVDELGTRFFTFRSQRYVWSESQQRFAKVNLDLVRNKSCAAILRDADPHKGLSEAEALGRMSLLGTNLVLVPMPTLQRSLFDEFFRLDFVYQVFCLLVWCVFYYWFAATIVFVVCLAACLVRVNSKRQSQQRLKDLAEAISSVAVIRDSSRIIISSHHLTVGDIVIIQSSQEIAADMILVSGSCVMNESSLTGEPNPVPKTALQPSDRYFDPAFLDAKHTLFAGTTVTGLGSESARAVVYRIGAETDRGRMLSQILSPTRLSFKFDRQWNAVFGLLLFWGFINVLIGVVLFDWELEGWYYGIFTISQVMSPLLPAVFVSGQATTARRLAKRKRVHCVNLQRSMVAGKVKNVCFDKTGTLTEAGLSMNKLKVYNEATRLFEEAEIRTPEELLQSESASVHANEFAWALRLCHELQLSLATGTIVGGDVDCGMFTWIRARLVPATEMDEMHRRTDSQIMVENPVTREKRSILRHFEFVRSSMSSSVVTCTVDRPTDYQIYTKGSWETVSRMCRGLSPALGATVTHLAGQGLYVLAIATKPLLDYVGDLADLDRLVCETDLHLLGLIVFKNTALPDTAQVIQELKVGDCRPVMVTGDHQLTACKVARDCGILSPGASLILISANMSVAGDAAPPSLVMTGLSADLEGREFATIDDLYAEMEMHQVELAITGSALEILHQPFVDPALVPLFQLLVSHAKVFARMTPQQKVNVVELFMQDGVTAMVGDGANDAAALERSHCGIAVRSGAAGAAKEASVVAHFAAEAASVRPVVDVLRFGRCALSMTTAAYKNLVVYGEIMVCLSFTEMYLKIVPPEGYFIFVDAAVNSVMTWAIMRSKPANKLAPKRPSSSLLGYETVLSTVLQVACHWLWAGIIFAVLFGQSWFSCRQFDPRYVDHADWWTKGDNYEAVVLGLLCTFQWISVAPTFNFSGGFRQSWIRNWEVWVTWVVFLIFGLSLIWQTATPFTCMFRTNCGDATLLNHWYINKSWDGIVDHPVDQVNHSIFIPPGCPCVSTETRPNELCEDEYTASCGQTTFNSTFHHNIMPREFRQTLTWLLLANIACGILIERLIILGPIGRAFRK